MQRFSKIIGYIRVSTAEQAADGRTSLQAQEREIRGVGMVHGINQIEIYADPGVSGAIPLNDRPAGARLCAALEPGVLVVASKLDRIFRSASDALASVDSWTKCGVHLVLVDLGVEPVSANGSSKLFFGILASVAEFEKSRIAERMNEGRAGKRARGGHVGGAVPYGFKKIGEGRAALLQRDEAEQMVLAHIKNLRASGCTYAEMIELLTARGVYLRSGKPWTNSQLHRVLNAAPREVAS